MGSKRKPQVPKIKLDKATKTWFLEYYDVRTGRRERPRISPRKDIAEIEANRIFNEMKSAFFGIDEKTYPDIDLDELIRLWDQSLSGRVAPSSQKRYRSFAENFGTFMKTSFSKIKKASEVRRLYIDEFLERQQDAGYKPKTLNNQIFVIKAIFKFAVEGGYIRESKVDTVKRFRNRQEDKQPEFWTKDEIKAILDNVRPHWRDAFEFLYVTGLRVSEMINLTWNDINLKTKPPTMAIQSKEQWTAKTAGIKTIPLNSRAVELIQKQTRTGKYERIFKGPQGGKIKYDDIHHRLDETLKKLGLPGKLHKFRHSFATQLSIKGKSLKSISELLGHKNIEQTMRYAHISEGHLKDVSESLLEDD